MKKNIKDLTKDGSWTTEIVTNAELQTSCLMRIADATEAMAKNYVSLLQELDKAKEEADRYYRWYQQELDENQKLKHSIAGHKAAYTKLKNKQIRELNNES